MNILKLSAAAALVAASLSASAMTTIADEDLSSVAGQDGVSIAANLNINIGSFTWGNNADATNNKASVSFNGIHISGLVAMTIDVISGTQFNQLYTAFTGTGAGGSGAALSGDALGLIGQATTAQYNNAVTANAGAATIAAARIGAGAALEQTGSFYNGASDVVQFAFPNVKIADKNDLMNISVNSITLGTNGVSAAGDKSFGSFSINQLDLRGTTVWMWAH